MLCVGSHLLSLRESPFIAVGEHERTRTLPSEILFPSISSAPSAGASVGAPQVTPLLCESPLSLSLSVNIWGGGVYLWV